MPESVAIQFDGHEVGWVMPVHLKGQPMPGPTATLLRPDDSEQSWRDGLEIVQRFLSALAFEYDTRVESAARSGGSGEVTLLAHTRSRGISGA